MLNAQSLARFLRPLLAVLAILPLWVGPAVAVGPEGLFDGVWYIEETGPGVGPNPYDASVQQKGDSVVGILLSLDGEWIYVLGIRSRGAHSAGRPHTPPRQDRPPPARTFRNSPG